MPISLQSFLSISYVHFLTADLKIQCQICTKGIAQPLTIKYPCKHPSRTTIKKLIAGSLIFNYLPTENEFPLWLGARFVETISHICTCTTQSLWDNPPLKANLSVLLHFFCETKSVQWRFPVGPDWASAVDKQPITWILQLRSSDELACHRYTENTVGRRCAKLVSKQKKRGWNHYMHSLCDSSCKPKTFCPLYFNFFLNTMVLIHIKFQLGEAEISAKTLALLALQISPNLAWKL